MELTIAPLRAPAPAQTTPRDLRPDLLWLTALAALLVLDIRTIGALPVHHDIAWPLYLARRLLGGARLYVDIIEVHPPLVIWWATLASLVSRALGVSDIGAYHALSLLAVVASVGLSAFLLRRLLPDRPWVRATLLVLQAFLLLPFVGYSLGQEEHLMLTLTWPYLLAAALAARGEPTGRWGWLIGAMAAVGFAMKPLYGLTWLAVEVYVVVSRRRLRLRPESIAVAVGVVAYVGAVVAFTPAYFRMLGWAAASYAYYFTGPLFRIVLVRQSFLVFCALLAAFLPRYRHLATLRHVLAPALVASTIIVYAQRKGWTYHWYPALALAIYLLAAVGLEQLALRRRQAPDAAQPAPGEAGTTADPPTSRTGPRWLSPALATTSLALGLLVGAGFMLAHTRREYRDLNVPPYYLPGMRYIVQAFGRGGPIMSISDIMQPVFPLVNYTNVRYASRFSCLWMLPGLYAREWTAQPPFPYHDARRASPLERYMVDAVIEDIQRSQPKLIIVDLDPPFMLPGFSYFVYFSRDARFRTLMGHYERLAKMQRYMIFRRTD